MDQLGLDLDLIPQRRIFSVAEIATAIRTVVSGEFPDIWVTGEISGLKLATSGHYYFTLKDRDAQLRAVAYRTAHRYWKVKPQDGLCVNARGRIDFYESRGDLQFQVDFLEPQGLGALQLAFEQLKKKLAAEGVFEASRKRPLPHFPRTIGIVTSPSGAVLRDMLHIIGRRFGDIRILVAPVRVQGDGAALDIVRALRNLDEVPDLDVVIVGRGGGSIEDLWAFNDERVARAIVACRAPVISAVGHETDFTIADFVADLRAPTPSGAAELVVREKLAVIRSLVELYGRLKQAMRARAEQGRERTVFFARRRVFTDPTRALRDRHRRVDDLAVRLRAAVRSHRRHLVHRAALATNALSSLHPLARISQGRAVLAQLRSRLVAAGGHSVKASRHRFETSVGRLGSLSPLAVLGRGYSLTRLPSGAVVRRAGETHPGVVIEILLHEGALDARVERVKERDERHEV